MSNPESIAKNIIGRLLHAIAKVLNFLKIFEMHESWILLRLTSYPENNVILKRRNLHPGATGPCEANAG
jgi:hypothetical protein